MGVTTDLIKEKEIVYVKKGDVFTNSLIISRGAKVSHKKIKAVITKHKDKLNELGNRVVSRCYIDDKGKPDHIYDLNEQQSTFLITLLKNTDSVVKFKMELVKMFFSSREELRKRENIMPQFMLQRRNMTDAIKDLPESPHKHMKYIHYTNLLYQTVTGFTAKKLKEIRGFKKNSTPCEFLTAEELEKITYLETKLAVLIDAGLEFSKIKSIMSDKFSCKLVTKNN